MDRVSDRMIGGVGGVRVGRSIGGALALGMVAAGSSESVGGRKRPTEARALVSGMVGVWDGSRKPFICGPSRVWDGRSNGDDKPLVLVLLGQNGPQRRGQKSGVWCRQRGHQLRVATTLSAARSSESESSASISVSEGVDVRDGSGRGRRRRGQRQRGRRRQGRQRRLCYVRGRRQQGRRRRVVGGSEGIGGVWYTVEMVAAAASDRALAASGLQRRWRS